MKVKLASEYGFCFGIKNAVKIAEENPGASVIGDIMHNPEEKARLARDFNVTTQSSLDIEPGQTAIIRPHGIAQPIEKNLSSRGVVLKDATCPNVKAIHKKIHQLDSQGYQIILLGDANHPEVLGEVSYARKPVTVVKNLAELKSLNINLDGQKIALLAQTTQNPNNFHDIERFLRERTDKPSINNTICNATYNKHMAVLNLLKDIDVGVVVGGRH